MLNNAPVMAAPQKNKNWITIGLAISLLGKYPKEMKSRPQRDIHSPMFITLFLTVKIWKQLKCPSMDK